ncbi:MAG: PriCT-2 domain-containing protein [Planctomycetaceae bacterium]|nr:PriCT-2 domain-containing protein [Planctomycetaceae bacterium]
MAGFGLNPVVFDSNGKGGYWVRSFFKKPIPGAVARWLGDQIKGRIQEMGLPDFEWFPKQSELTLACPYGNWIRIPGRHHKRNYWTRIAGSAPGEWLEGEAAARRLIAVAGDDPKRLLDAYKAANPSDAEAKSSRSSTRDTRESPDVETLRSALAALPDEIVAKYDSWLNVGMALHLWDSERGLELWEGWSKTCEHQYEDRVCEAKWGSFSDTVPEPFTVGSIFYLAKQNGWKRPSPAEKSEDQEDTGRHEVLSNYWTETVIDSNGKERQSRVPLSVNEIRSSLESITPGWPKSSNGRLFVQGDNHRKVELKKVSSLFAWIHGEAGVEWGNGENLVTKEEFFEFLGLRTEQCEAVETLPHEPPIPGHVYMHRPLPEPTRKLDGLLDFFSPATPVDRELIKAFCLTCFWGGPLGKRPAFMATGPDKDEQQGRGVGKSTLFDILATHLVGSYFTVSVKEDMPDITRRLLSGSAAGRIGRIDNLKVLKFSWADFEGLLTSEKINGHAMYVGNQSIPNTLVWTITVNGASLSKDMAQRTVCIKLARPTYRPTWGIEIVEYIQKNRWEIIAELISILKEDRPEIEAKTRWSEWEQQVLSHVSAPTACIDEILSRQKKMDEGQADQDTVKDYFEGKLLESGYPPDESHVFITSMTVAEWVSEATRKPYESGPAQAFVKQLQIPELEYRPEQRKVEGKPHRGWVWKGVKAGNLPLFNFKPADPALTHVGASWGRATWDPR